jgi:hypothetical protein
MTRTHTRPAVLMAASAVAFAVLVFKVADKPMKAMAQQRTTETVDRTLPFPSGGTLKLNNFSGRVRITGGPGRNFVMKAVRRGTAERLKEIELAIDTSGSTISVEANKRLRNDSRRWRDDDGRDSVIDTDFEIQVPSDARLDIDSFSSDVTVTGVNGEQRLKSFSGDLEIDATGQGTSPDLDVETFSGMMRVRLADNARGEIEFNSFSGDLDSAFPVSLRSSSRRNLRAELPGGSGRTLRFKSFSGTLRLVK